MGPPVTTTPPKLLLIPEPLAQAIMDKLVMHPYRDVHELVAAMLALPDAADS